MEATRRRRFVALVLGLALGGCGGGSKTPGGQAGQSGQDAAGQSGGGAGSGGSSGAAGSGGSSGAAGDTSVAGTTGAAGDTSAAGTTGAAGNTSAAGTTGTAGTSADAGAGGATDAGAPADAAPRSNKVLIYGVTTGFRHDSITAAAMAITTAAEAKGLTTELVGCTDATNKPDATKFTAEALAGYGAVILLAMSGEPFGYPATTEIQNLIDYVQGGGALIGIEDADHCYDGTFGHPATPSYVNLIGNDFSGHPGGVAPATCTTVGTQESVALLPATFATDDEIYAETMFRADNQVVLTCVSSADGTKRPISYVREEGAGRVFYTALGHLDASWTMPMDPKSANSRLVEDHVLPALLWAMRR
jgi:type 1 glutamine amidotransferase